MYTYAFKTSSEIMSLHDQVGRFDYPGLFCSFAPTPPVPFPFDLDYHVHVTSAQKCCRSLLDVLQICRFVCNDVNYSEDFSALALFQPELGDSVANYPSEAGETRQGLSKIVLCVIRNG